MSNDLSVAESNALSVVYEVSGQKVSLDMAFVKKYLVRGKSEYVTDQEIVFYMNTCKAQRLNPLVQGEVYLIKYSKEEPAQMVVGKMAYLNRAFCNPDYICKEDGITVTRGTEYVQKEGCCLYPGENLIGAWCRVHVLRSGKERTVYKEVSLAEYNKGMANWKSKPATMLNKVAVSQALREAFPKDYEGLYAEEEMIASGAIPIEAVSEEASGNDGGQRIITKEERQALFALAHELFGKERGNEIVKEAVLANGFSSTQAMTFDVYKTMVDEIRDRGESIQREPDSDQDPPFDDDEYETPPPEDLNDL